MPQISIENACASNQSAPMKVPPPEMVTARKCHLRPRRLHRRSPAGYRPSSGQHSLTVVDRWRASCSPGRAPLIGADAVLRRSRSLPELVTQKNVTSGHIGFAGGRLPDTDPPPASIRSSELIACARAVLRAEPRLSELPSPTHPRVVTN